MKRESRIAPPVPQVESPLRHLPYVDLLVDTKTELLELALRSGLRVFATMLEEDRTAICGPRYTHAPDRPATGACRDATSALGDLWGANGVSPLADRALCGSAQSPTFIHLTSIQQSVLAAFSGARRLPLCPERSRAGRHA